jgi:putative hydrolase
LKRIDLHIHSLLSDGELLPSEIARRAEVLDHEAIAITDHVDSSNLEAISKVIGAIEDINNNWSINVVPGAEITHAPVEVINRLAKKSRKLGAEIIIVHGETLAEPVVEGTNLAAVKSSNVDILAHPGLITVEEAEHARKNNVTLEISARKGHSLANGHVVNIATDVGVDLIINTDTHSPGDLITFEQAKKVGLGTGLSNDKVIEALVDNPKKILERHGFNF